MSSTSEFVETVAGMSALVPARGRSHPWWALAGAVEELMKSEVAGDKKAVKALQESFARLVDKK